MVKKQLNRWIWSSRGELQAGDSKLENQQYMAFRTTRKVDYSPGLGQLHSSLHKAFLPLFLPSTLQTHPHVCSARSGPSPSSLQFVPFPCHDTLTALTRFCFSINGSPPPSILTGKFHGWGSLSMDWGHNQSDATEGLTVPGCFIFISFMRPSVRSPTWKFLIFCSVCLEMVLPFSSPALPAFYLAYTFILRAGPFLLNFP